MPCSSQNPLARQMASPGDLINFDVIEGQKENIQSLPSGRSAKKLADLYSPLARHIASTPTPADTRSVNDCIRGEYEAEIQNISESDDPLDVYDRYVKWTFDAYPSAQATPASQLHTTLERATKSFISSQQYKNDPRYLKLWLHYIHFFSDAPRETFVFLSRHSIGETLALFYEEYAEWLEGAGRWTQAEEVYKLGIEREARPVQRLLRKFKDFEQRLAQQSDAGNGPSSPALPLMRPALVAKVDPFGAASHPTDPQVPRPTNGGVAAAAASRPSKSKLTIFSDADSAPSAMSSRAAGSKGWDTIGSSKDRKKENVMEAKPWAGETLKAGGKKQAPSKMAVFRDPSLAQINNVIVVPSQHQITVHPLTGKRERIFVDLAAVYPTPEEPGTERSFEEIIAVSRGWLDSSSWQDDPADQPPALESKRWGKEERLPVHRDGVFQDENGNFVDVHQEPRPFKKKKTMEVNETQIIKAKLDSPTGSKLRKRSTAEPTMTLHTRAATDDIYDIFNAPLQPLDAEEREDESAEDEFTDEEYTSDAESLGATRHLNDNEPAADPDLDAQSVSGWSEQPVAHTLDDRRHLEGFDATGAFKDGCETELSSPHTRTTFIPIPPENYEPRTHPYRDAAEVANNRLPFMTPITERTEVSLDLGEREHAERFKTPCKPVDVTAAEPNRFDLEPLSSPLREIINEERPSKKKTPLSTRPAPSTAKAPSKTLPKKRHVIEDVQCNPVDDCVRAEIIANLQPPLPSYAGFHDHRDKDYSRGGEIRKFIKSLGKGPKAGVEKAAPSVAPVTISFPYVSSTYTVKRELGAGAFAPVYLVHSSGAQDHDQGGDEDVAVMGKGAFAVRQRSDMEALKMETPPTPWEFHMMRLAHSRLGSHHRAAASLSYAHEMHLFRDEAFLLLPYHPYGTLLDTINFFRSESSGVMDEQLAMFFSIELLRTVEALHSKQLMHGDLKPDNCLLRLDKLEDPLSSKWSAGGAGGWHARGLVLIDFGRAIDMRSFHAEVQFIADWKTSSQDCAEMREGRPWTWQIDYHGLAGVIHCLLFGKYIETVRADQGVIGRNGRRYKIKENLKRYWQTDIWSECFEVLLNPAAYAEAEEEARRMPALHSLKRVREMMERWLEDNCEKGAGLRSLMGKVENYAKKRQF